MINKITNVYWRSIILHSLRKSRQYFKNQEEFIEGNYI